METVDRESSEGKPKREKTKKKMTEGEGKYGQFGWMSNAPMNIPKVRCNAVHDVDFNFDNILTVVVLAVPTTNIGSKESNVMKYYYVSLFCFEVYLIIGGGVKANSVMYPVQKIEEFSLSGT